MTPDEERSVDRRLLAELDTLLARVPDAIPWAERPANSVDFVESPSSSTLRDTRVDPAGVSELYALCSSISMADVDNGWFIHPRARADRDDEFIPRSIVGRGPCFPIGSDGVGGWLVVDDEGAVLMLAEGAIRANRYEPAGSDSVVVAAESIRGLIRFFIERVRATITT